MYLSALCEGSQMHMCNIKPMPILKHLQKNVMGNQETAILALQDKIHQYHHTCDTIVEYTEAMELVKK